MYRNILMAYDGTGEGTEVIRQGGKLARMCQAEVFLLAVLATDPGNPPDEATREKAARIVREGVAELESMGLASRGGVEIGEPVERIISTARENRHDLIIVGHRRMSRLARWWRGSTGASLVAEAPCSVLVTVGPQSPANPN